MKWTTLLAAAVVAGGAQAQARTQAHGVGGGFRGYNHSTEQGGSGGHGQGGGGGSFEHNSTLVACVDNFLAVECPSCTALPSFFEKAQCLGTCLEVNAGALEAQCLPALPTWAPHNNNDTDTDNPATWQGGQNETHGQWHGHNETHGHGGHGRRLWWRGDHVNSSGWGSGSTGNGVPSMWLLNGFADQVNTTCIETFISACNCGGAGFFQEAFCLDTCLLPQLETIRAECLPAVLPAFQPPAFTDGERNQTWPGSFPDSDGGEEDNNGTWGYHHAESENTTTPRGFNLRGLRRLSAE